MSIENLSGGEVEKVRTFFDAVEEYLDYGTYTEPNEEVEEESIDLTPSEFAELVRSKFTDEFRHSWRRMVYGCDLLMEQGQWPTSDK